MKKDRQAFTLLETAMVIIIIGVLAAGIFVADGMVTKSRITAAKSLTNSSPVNEVGDSALWLETTLDSSFNDFEADNGNQLSDWYDQRKTVNKVVVVPALSRPIYSNTINKIHAVEFDGAAGKNFKFDGSFLNKTDYTIIVLEKRKSANSDNYFLGSLGSGSNNSLALGYNSNSSVVHAQGSNSYGSNVSSYSQSRDAPRVFTFISNSDGKKTYINGLLASQSVDTSQLTGISEVGIGERYVGEIGEIVIFTRGLKDDERTSIENYVAQKFSMKLPRSTAPSGSCVGYTITPNGCDLSSATCNINQTGLTATVAATSSSTSISCNPNYIGSVTYTCISGVPNVSGTCTAVSNCNSVSRAGVLATMTAAHGATANSSCTDTPYFTGTSSFTCDNGSQVDISVCSCATGYTGSDCRTCDSGYGDNGSGGCGLKCLVSVSGAASSASVNPGSSTLACSSSSNYAGTAFSYTCSGGATITGNCACASGHSFSGGSCVSSSAPCAVTGGGTTDVTTVPGSTIHVFTSNGTLSCATSKSAQVLVVGGGGGGSADVGGGGGGGQVSSSSLTINTSATITVGAGGARGYNRVGNSTGGGNTGGTSSIVSGSTTISALGGSGARGRAGAVNNFVAGTGFTGGGAGYPDENSAGSTGVGGSGYKGGDSNGNGGGGGGGAGGVGQSRAAGAAGGVGVGSAIATTGSLIYYGGGGGGSGYVVSGGVGGNGGGGNGTSDTTNGYSGTDGSGGGGGGAGSNGASSGGGGTGGKGVVIVRY